jgi:Na+/H+ antiporter NhaD/arsenite permease-like protein
MTASGSVNALDNAKTYVVGEAFKVKFLGLFHNKTVPFLLFSITIILLQSFAFVNRNSTEKTEKTHNSEEKMRESAKPQKKQLPTDIKPERKGKKK